MKLFYKLPQNLYVDVGFNNSMSIVNNFEIYVLRETEDGSETRFLSLTYQYNKYFFPFDKDFILDNFRPLYLEKLDGSYECKLVNLKREDGKIYGYPWQSFKTVNENFMDDLLYNNSTLSQFDFREMETEDGQYVIFFSNCGCNVQNSHKAKELPSIYSSKENIKLVLTEKENYDKELGAYYEEYNKIKFFDDRIFYVLHGDISYFYFHDLETGNAKFRIKTKNVSRYIGSSSYYLLSNNKLTWKNTEISPPSGYSLEYDLMTVEHWYAKNTLYSLTVYKIPPWNGSKAKYVFTFGSTLFFKLDNLSTIEYNETEKKWQVFDSSRNIQYEYAYDDDCLDNTITHHFDFVGTLNEGDKQEISEGFDLSLYTKYSMLVSLDSLVVDENYADKFKEIVMNYKKETGFTDNYIFDQPYFI